MFFRYAKFAASAIAISAFGCTGERTPSQQGEAVDSTAVAPADAGGTGRSYQRSLVFVGRSADGRVVVPWLFSSRAAPGVVEREIRAWLLRDGVWDSFFDDQWMSAPTRAPWRILPRERLRLVMGGNDTLERIVFDDGPRKLELVCSEALADWSGPRGTQVRVIDASVSLSGVPVDGVLVDLSRTWRTDEGIPGDWAFLTSGDSVQIILQDPGSSVEAPTYRAWARWGEVESQWPDVRVEWSEVRAFEPARRDVPSTWVLNSEDGELEGSISVTSARIEAGTGAGPLLPVDALLEVEGTVSLFGRSVPVEGLVRHMQR